VAWLVAWCLLLPLAPARAREGAPPPSARYAVQPLEAIAPLALPPTDVAAELARDAAKALPGPAICRAA